MRIYDVPQSGEDLNEVRTEMREELEEEYRYHLGEIGKLEGYRRGEDPEWAAAIAEDPELYLKDLDNMLAEHTPLRDSQARALAAMDREPEDDDPGFEEVTAAMAHLTGDNPSIEMEFTVSPEAWWSLAHDGRFTLDMSRPGDLELEVGETTWVVTGDPDILDIDRVHFNSDEFDGPYIRQGPLGGVDTYSLPAGAAEDTRGLYTGLRQNRTRSEAITAMADVLAQQAEQPEAPAPTAPPTSHRPARGQGLRR